MIHDQTPAIWLRRHRLQGLTIDTHFFKRVLHSAHPGSNRIKPHPFQ
ncbi:hypothetical protein [Parachitinimonas caeni]|uniref:Uncharacterized protein n=1 Tax=Parachitinimonas caeni TaxID=3031301 RepID=A0ABT7E1I3_9NEIS|nr:hypothetical protein [Parachitinimonas caeni]MDK2126172.1 hypothetical protein [Parachitinimonas caeni]